MLNQVIGKIDPTTDAGRVHTMDLTFAIIAFNAGAIAFMQTKIYPSHACLLQTKVVVSVVVSIFLFVAILECWFGVPLKSYMGVSLINLSAFIKAASSFVKYNF